MDEDFKFFLAHQMQSFAPKLLQTLLDKRKVNQTSLFEPRLNEQCQSDLIKLSSSAMRNELWALKAFDSSGALASGLSSGRIFNSIGNYQQCLELSTGFQYCLAKIDLSYEAAGLSSLTGLAESLFLPTSGGSEAKFGLCSPTSCSKDDITTIANQMLKSSFVNSRLVFGQLDCFTSNHERYNNQTLFDSLGFIISLAFIIISLSLSISATILDSSSMESNYYHHHHHHHHHHRSLTKKSRKLHSFIGTFSLIRAYRKLVEKRPPASTGRPALNLRPLDGLRVLSTLWIIIIHSYNFATQWLLFDNVEKVNDNYKTLGIQWIANGTFSVDNFFLISGFLASFKHYQTLFTNQDETSLSLNHVLSRIFHRYLRLIPILMILILFSVNLLPKLAYGAQWENSTVMFADWCQSNWYLNLFMLQNLISTQNLCFSHSWYVASDFQLFILLELVLLILSKLSPINYGGRGGGGGGSTSNLYYLLVLLFPAVSQTLVALLIYLNSLPAVPLLPADSLEAILNYYKLIYIKPYYWLASYFLGAYLAHIVISRTVLIKKNKQVIRLTNKLIFIIQATCLSILAALLASTLPYFKGTIYMTRIQAAIYSLIVRPLWSLCTCCLLLFCMLNKQRETNRKDEKLLLLLDKLINNLLGSNLWPPLSRLTYSAYLLHPVVMATFYGSRMETFEFDNFLLIYFTIGHIALTYFISTLIYLFIELPINNLIRQLFTTIIE